MLLLEATVLVLVLVVLVGGLVCTPAAHCLRVSFFLLYYYKCTTTDSLLALMVLALG
jgi:hypothetical protein